jgi:hypothetical protein
MSLFVVLFWCAILALDVLFRNSRLGVFNSRLGAKKFPFSRQRELARMQLICLALLAARGRVWRGNRRISRHNGKNREWGEAMLSGAAR